MTRVTASTECPSLPMDAINFAELLDPAHLTNEQAIKSALNIIEQYLTEGNCIAVIEKILLIANPQSTAIFLSGICSSLPVEKWILKNITFDMYCRPDSIASRLLSNLSTFFNFDILLTKNDATASELAKRHREAQAVCSVIPALISFRSRTPSRTRLTPEDNDPHDPIPLLVELDIPLPTDSSEAKFTLLRVIERQKRLLSFYLNTIRMPEIQSEIMTKFSELNGAHDPNTSEPHEGRSVPSTLKKPYHEAIKSFGMWKILISGRANEDLRRWRRGNSEVFLNILKKIRDLSNGDFSPNNQSRVNRCGDDIVPIFEAKVVSDHHLIYQVDCLPETENEEKQAIKIFGVYSSTEHKTEFWDVVGKQLASKGKAYKDRCLYRVPLNGNSDRKYFIPAVFPPITIKLIEEYSNVDVLRTVQDREWLQTISVLQKFVPFSRALLHSIYADLDAIFPVEVSLEEKLIIEHPSSCYVLGRSGTGKTTTMLYKMLQIHRGFQIHGDRKRQIFVTKSSILAEKVQEHFNEMLESLEVSSRSPGELKETALSRKHEPCDDLVDKDEDTDLHASTLPERFSDLKDEHFPLFLTFNNLCMLLAGDLVGAVGSNMSHAYRLALNDPGLRRENFVSYERFRGRHWRHHSQKSLDPYSVFNELLGVIEGSELAASSPQRYIDANAYESLSRRGYSTFSTKRGIVYEIFQSYRKMKQEMGEYDAADRTHALLRSIEIYGVPGQKFDYIYVDEAQDNLMIDALLLRMLCRNSDGLFWAGDTAQTISSGCSFRFQDLKSMLYRVERQAEEINPESSFELPKTFSLTVNYRSHTGITNCAHSIVELIQRYWPYSIDVLAPERGFFIGPLPVFLAMCHSDNIQFKHSPLGSRLVNKQTMPSEFGANQCILVRNKEVKMQLKKTIGGNVLTIYESKGLEFNDVLLYNFFEDSMLEPAQWRLVLKQGLERFDALKSIGLCTELKSLYVAITRAKKNLWIADCSEKAKPMKDYWLKQSLVHVRTVGEEDLLRLAETSTAEEWFDMGKIFFERKQYSEARSCFERASRPRERGAAHAYALREHASKLPMGKPTEAARREAFLEAAEAFRSCFSKHNLVYFRRSGECFEAAEQYLQAAKAYYQGENYTQSVVLYRRLGKFDEAIAIVFDKKDKVRPDIVDSVKNAARLFYLSSAETNSTALEKAKRLFDTEDDLLKYLGDMCLDGVRGTVLSSLGRYAEAIESFVAAGRFLDAIELLVMDKGSNSTRQACRYIIQELWKLMPFGFRAGNVESDGTISKLLALSKGLEKNFLRVNELSEVEMFLGIFSNNRSTLRKLGETFFDIRNFPASAHCFEQIYHGRLPQFDTTTLQELAESLRIFQMYVHAMFTITIQTDPRNSPVAPRLFGFEARKRNRFFVPKGTFFYAAAGENASKRVDDGFLISEETLGVLYRRTLEAHLKNLLLQENESCLHCPALNIYPCINFLLQGNCKKPKGSCTRPHLRLSNFDSSWYNRRIHVHLVQISILQTMASLLDYQELNRHRRIWISRLYEALHPPLYLLGSFAQFDPSLIPDYGRYLRLLKGWIRELVYDQSSHPSQLKYFITNLLRSLDLGLTFDRAESCNYLYRAKFMAFPPIPDHLRPPHGTYIVFEAINSLRDENNWLPSLTQGILFSKHVVDKCLPVDMGALCKYLDFLCGQSIVSASIQYYRGVLHEVLLPKSWWITQMIQPGCNANKSTRLSRLLFDVISSLLSKLLGSDNADIEHLLHHSQAIKSETAVRWAYVTRLCRAVCLLGHNLRWYGLKQSILGIFSRLSSLVFSPLCGMYFRSRNWSDIVIALHAGSYDLPREQLILVCNRRVTSARDMRLERYYQRLNYTDKGDLLAALRQSWSGSKNREEAPQVRKNIMNTTVEVKNEQPDPVSLNQEPTHEIENGSILLDDIEEELQEHYGSSQNTPVTQAGTLTDEEQKAGSIIRNAYRSYFRGKAMSRNTSALLTRSTFKECLEQSQTVKWPRRSRYKLLYLGPLPNLLACLECVWADIGEKRAEARKKLGKALGHDALDHESAKLVKLSEHNEVICRLREALGPKGNIHQSRDEAMLKWIVLEAVTFIREFPDIAKGEMRWDLEAAEKGILKEKKEKKESKPELHVEDELDGDDLY